MLPVRSIRFTGLCLVLCMAPAFVLPAASTTQRLPNVVLIFADDLGYGDLGCYGSKSNRTPNLDRLAKEGLRFTSFCVPQAVCSASRAALMTGCYPNRVGILGALGPRSRVGISSNETTMAEALKSRGYATAVFGKWHLGHQREFLPTRHGFDEYFGLPYSNDMWPNHPSDTNYPPLPLIEGERVVQVMPDQTQLTTWYAERAVGFIKRNRDRPFFLYMPHAMPHVPLFVSDKFKGRTGNGLYADVIAEIDWSVGQVLDTLKRLGLDERTWVIFTSDNGPWLLYGNHAGRAGPLREGKGTSFEGGVRVPCLMRWPGKIPAGRECRELATTMDLLPTVARLAGVKLPTDRIIDGRDLWPLMSGKRGAKSPHEAFFYYWGGELQAVRSGPWKLHLGHSYVKPSPPGGEAKPGKYATPQIGVELFHLEEDIGESKDVAAAHPKVVARLKALAERAREDLGDTATKREGANRRPSGRVEE